MTHARFVNPFPRLAIRLELFSRERNIARRLGQDADLPPIEG